MKCHHRNGRTASSRTHTAAIVILYGLYIHHPESFIVG